MVAKVFIGSSSESLDISQTVQRELRRHAAQKFLPVVWNQDTVRLTKYLLPELVRQISDCSYAIFIFHADDLTTTRSRRRPATRDNVIFEFGLAAGILGYERCFVFKSSGVKLPSDFEGFQFAEYHMENYRNNKSAEMGAAVSSFIEAVSADKPIHAVTWQNFCENVDLLCGKLRKSLRQGGFRYDYILGISRGGIIAADLIGRRHLSKIPVICLWGDHYTHQPEVDFDAVHSPINRYIFDFLSQADCKNILLVDDITRSGTTIVKVKNMLADRFPACTVKSAVLYVPSDKTACVDYFAEATDDPSIAMPYGVLD